MTDSTIDAMARYAAEVDVSLAMPVREEVARRVLDALACAFMARDGAGPKAARGYAYSSPGVSESRVWGTTFQADAEKSALVNGVAVRYLDLNDAYFALEGCHPSDVIPGIIAVGETLGASGAEVAQSIAVAYEVAMAVADMGSLRANGWDHVNVTGLGACAGIGRLMGLTSEQQEHALAIQVVSHAAMRQTRQSQLSMWKGFAAADCVRHAVYVCRLVRAGVTGPAEAFEGRHGAILHLFGGAVTNHSPIDVLREMNTPRRILETHVKVWPFGYVAQSAVEAAQQVFGQLPPNAVIEDVRIETFQAGVDLMGTDEKWTPRTRETADHSLPYVVYEMLTRGVVDEESFGPTRFADPATHAFLKNHVEVLVDEEFTRRYPDEFPSRVTVHAGGRSYSHENSASLGHASRPMDSTQVKDKFLSGALQVFSDKQAAELADAALGLSDLTNIRDLTALTVA